MDRDATPSRPKSLRKDLRDLVGLSRRPFTSFLQKHGAPLAPRAGAEKTTEQPYPMLAAFARSHKLLWLYEYLSLRFGPRHPFLAYGPDEPDQGVYRLQGENEGQNGEVVRIALAGDWATGTDEAEHVARTIADYAPHYSIHLGDVYYVGGASEVDENFLGRNNPANGFDPTLWPAGSRGSFALNGNHEMYARGYAYFKRMLPRLGLIERGAARGQKASFFCLENDFWRIIGLDTAYNSIGWPIIENIIEPSCELQSEQIVWLRERVRFDPSDRRGVILLTHHQYYSNFDDWFPTPARQLAPLIARPVLWFWGHEHRLAIYPEYGEPGGLRAFGRCIGHGGMPVDLPPQSPRHPECPTEFVDRRLYENDEGLNVGYNGSARLTLRGAEAHVDYIDLSGQAIFKETWSSASGALTRLSAQALV